MDIGTSNRLFLSKLQSMTWAFSNFFRGVWIFQQRIGFQYPKSSLRTILMMLGSKDFDPMIQTDFSAFYALEILKTFEIR